jgi:hypothetical protein
MAQDGVECALGSFWGMVRVVPFDLKSLFSKKIDVGTMSATKIQYPPSDTTEAEELSSRK